MGRTTGHAASHALTFQHETLVCWFQEAPSAISAEGSRGAKVLTIMGGFQEQLTQVGWRPRRGCRQRRTASDEALCCPLYPGGPSHRRPRWDPTGCPGCGDPAGSRDPSGGSRWSWKGWWPAPARPAPPLPSGRLDLPLQNKTALRGGWGGQEEGGSPPHTAAPRTVIPPAEAAACFPGG